MKKLYTILASACVAAMVSASAFTMPGTTNFDKGKELKLHSMDEVKLVTGTNPHQYLIDNLKDGAASRAEEEEVNYDPSQFTQWLYFDYFANIRDENGNNHPDGFAYKMSSYASEMEWSEDGSYITVYGFAGYNFNWQIQANEEGLYIPLGQVLYSNATYDYVLSSISQEGELIYDGAIELDLFTNAIVQEGYLGVCGFEKSSGKFAGWVALNFINQFFAPNATLQYLYAVEDETGQVQVAEVINPVFCQLNEGENGSNDQIMLSNVMPFNEGCVVYFDIISDFIVGIEQVAYFSEMDSETTWSGDFYMCSFAEDGTGFPYVALQESVDEEGYTVLSWPNDLEDIDLNNIVSWGVICEKGYWFGEFGPAKLTLGKVPAQAGISDVINDNTPAGPTEYYNLQGVKVSNPAAGQIFIVKEGNKVTKKIIR